MVILGSADLKQVARVAALAARATALASALSLGQDEELSEVIQALEQHATANAPNIQYKAPRMSLLRTSNTGHKCGQGGNR